MNRYHAILFAITAVLLFSAPAQAAAAPVFDAPSISCPENSVNCSLIINKSAVSKSYSKVQVKTVDGTAKAGVDYLSVDKTITISNSTLRTLVYIPVLDNATYQGSRTFAVALICVRYCQIAASMSGPTTVTITDDEMAPPPPPPPSNGLAGEADIPDNFDPLAWLEPGETPHESADAVGAFRFTMLSGHLLKDDPIVYPGQPGKSHLHQFFGNDQTDAYSTYQSLRTTGGSTATRSTGTSPQRSAYWMPAMLDGAGNAVKPDWVNTYYKQLPASDPKCSLTVDPANSAVAGPPIGKCVPLPNGIRFILGYNMASMTGGPNDSNSRDWWAMGWDCMDHVTGGTSYTGIQHTLAAVLATGKCPAGAWVRAYTAFPQCWDGKNLDSADHRSHIVFPPQEICPSDHPYKVPEVALQAFYTPDANFFAGKWHLSSDEAMPGTVAGSTLHWDYWEAWSPVIKALWQKGCIDGHITCASGNIGDGRQIKGMQMIDPRPNHVLVPLSSIP